MAELHWISTCFCSHFDHNRVTMVVVAHFKNRSELLSVFCNSQAALCSSPSGSQNRRQRFQQRAAAAVVVNSKYSLCEDRREKKKKEKKVIFKELIRQAFFSIRVSAPVCTIMLRCPHLEI